MDAQKLIVAIVVFAAVLYVTQRLVAVIDGFKKGGSCSKNGGCNCSKKPSPDKTISD